MLFEGLLGTRVFGLRALGFQGLGFTGLGFRVEDLGFTGLGFRVQGLGFRVQGGLVLSVPPGDDPSSACGAGSRAQARVCWSSMKTYNFCWLPAKP